MLQYVLGEVKKRDASLDGALAAELYSLKDVVDFPVETGITMCTDDFYEGMYMSCFG